MASGVVLSDDLIFASRITGTAQALGHAVVQGRSLEQFAQLVAQTEPAGVVVDLEFPGLDLPALLTRLGEGRPFVVAYGSHVDAAGLKAARAAGCELVLPRSAFVERLPADLPAWLAGRAE